MVYLPDQQMGPENNSKSIWKSAETQKEPFQFQPSIFMCLAS